MRLHVVLSVMKRNLASYFSGLLGYLFIIVFVVLGAICAFQNEFFRGNQCTLDQLSQWFPWLLLFIVPAITMNVWAEERRRGTDELLFTLPGTDLEILLGKYLSVVVVYTSALGFSLTHALVLEWLGNPDRLQLAATYLGYWCAGCALLATGMVASSLTNSTAVAFVLGAVFCAVPVGLRLILGGGDALRPFTVGYHLDEFARGTIPLQGVFYFGSLAVLSLYVNAALISRRRWSIASGMNMGWHYLIRSLSLAAVLISTGYMVRAVANWSIDMTHEQIYTLADITHRTLQNIDEKKPVRIEVFISDDVGAPYSRVKNELEGVLRRIEAAAGKKLEIRWVYLEPYSAARAKQAEDNGILPRNYFRDDETTTRVSEEEIYLGAVVRSGFDKVVIPFFDLGMSIEYELTRAIGTVINENRIRIGVLETDAKVMGGMDMQTFQTQPPWRIVEELQKQYEVVSVRPDELLGYLPSFGEEGQEDKLDVLLAVLPSSLTEQQMQLFLLYVRSGAPVLIFDDPITRFRPQLSPLEPKPTSQPGGMMQTSDTKADGGRLTSLMSVLQCAWEIDGPEPGRGFILMDEFNPHPELDYLPPSVVFITPESGTPDAINLTHPSTAGLQELLAWFPGTIRPRERADDSIEFTSLLRSSRDFSGLLNFSDVFSRDPFFGSRRIVDNPEFETGATRRVLTNRSGWTVNRRPAVEGTLLNELDDSKRPFAAGDVIVITGREERTIGSGDDRERTEETIRHEMSVSPVTTLKDVLEAINELFESAEATLDRTGRIVLRANDPGVRQLELELANKTSNFGELRFDVNPIEVLSEGSEGVAHVIAAAIRSKPDSIVSLNVIFVADIDLISDPLLAVEFGQQADLSIDNSRFVMNAIDTLAGSENFIRLRSRRSGMRTLERIEAVQARARQDTLRERRAAEQAAKQSLADFRAQLDRIVRQIEEDESLSVIAREQAVRTAIENTAVQFSRKQEETEQETRATIRSLRRAEQRSLRAAERTVRAWAIFIPPLPAVLLGLWMLVTRVRRERSTISPDRRLRQAA